MKKSRFLMLALTAAALTACGSDDNSDVKVSPTAKPGSSQSTGKTGNTGNTGSNTGNTGNTGNNTGNTGNTGGSTINTGNKPTAGAEFSAYTVGTNVVNNRVQLKPRSGNQAGKNTAKDINRLVVDGLNIPLGESGMITSGGFFRDNKGVFNRTGAANQLSYARYGWVYLDENSITAFFQGDMTQTLPTAGTAHYVGNAAYTRGTALSMGGPKSADFQVNFAAKTVQGNLKGGDGLSFNANIVDGTGLFRGKKDGFQVEGGFFGKNAEELAGAAVKAAGTSAAPEREIFVFGAKKQP